MTKKELHRIIEEYRLEFADPNHKIPNPDYEGEFEEYMQLLERLYKWLSDYSDKQVRGMFDKYIKDGGIFFPTAAGQLLKYKPTKEEQEGPYIPTYEESMEILKKVEEERAAKEKAEKELTQEERDEREKFRQQAFEEFKELQRKRGFTEGFRKIRVDFSDTESGDS